MRGVLALLGCTATMVLGAPALLSRARWSATRPATTLFAWCAAFVVGLATALASLGVALWVGLSSYRPEIGSEHRAVATTAVLVFCWAGLVSVGGLLSLVAIRSEPMTVDHRRTATLMTLLVSASAYRREALGRVTVTFVHSDRPVAVSLPGRPPRIVVASRLEDELTVQELRAVIEHERAHLVYRHGWLVQLAQLNAACLPGLPAAREFHRAARLLVELIADDVAARRCGRDDLAHALDKLAHLTGDEGLLLRAQRIAAGRGRARSAARDLAADSAPPRPVEEGEG